MDIKKQTIGVIGAGTMGSGIAQVAAHAGHPVKVYDTNSAVLQQAAVNLKAAIGKLIEKK